MPPAFYLCAIITAWTIRQNLLFRSVCSAYVAMTAHCWASISCLRLKSRSARPATLPKPFASNCSVTSKALTFDFPCRSSRTEPHISKKSGWPCATSRGETRSYGELATSLKSGAQAVGQACGANPIPIVIPCHRVVGKSGLGGFMRHASGVSLDIKRWLLAHEQR